MTDRDTDFRVWKGFRAYLATMLEDAQLREADEACMDEREPYDFGTVYTLSDEAYTSSLADWRQFVAANSDLVDAAAARDGYSHDSVGSDFWMTRAGHGTGFWDRSELGTELGEALTAACDPFRSIDCYVGNDGKVYVA